MLRTIAATTAALVVAVTLVPATPVAQASPGATALVLNGEGFGHGKGLSQYGARGRANAGHSYGQILSAYYPGTTLATGSDSNLIRVWIRSDTDQITGVVAEPGLVLRTSTATVALPATLPAGTPTQWRIRTVSGTLHLEALVAGQWRDPAISAAQAALNGARAADFRSSDYKVRLVLPSVNREYVGTIRAVLDGSVQRTVVVTSFTNYLPAVVTAEMPSTWPAQALAAQAVAARTYALFDQASKPSTAVYDTCDTTSCQVFNGIADYNNAGSVVRSWTTPSTRAAATATAGRYLSYAGAPAFTQFSASNGGHSAPGTQAYLQSRADPYDTYPSWQVSLSRQRLQSAYPQIGQWQSISISRDGMGPFGGRVTAVTLTGSGGSVTVTGAQFRSTFSLRSTLFMVTASDGGAATNAARLDFTGDGRYDLLAVGPGGSLNLWAGRGGTRVHSRAQIGNGWQAMAGLTFAAGLTGPGSTDLVAIQPSTGELWSYPAANGGFAPRVRIGSGGWNSMDALIGLAGWAGPGSVGILAREGSSGRLYYYTGTGTGRLRSRVQVGQGWSSMSLLTNAGDWDGNGTTDVVARDAAGRLWLYRGNGAGGFDGRRQIGHGWSVITALLGGADWNGDGDPDLIATDSSGRLWLYPGDGSGGFDSRSKIGSGWGSYQLIS
ncbi:MAG: SpoIID/LytB domain-containing protein [Beutenbergiaceae bacterium]